MTNLEKEQEIQRHIEVLGLTREQAEQLWKEDNADYVNEEMAEMERKAKANRRYEQSDKPRVKAKREPKIDQEKVKIIEVLVKALAESGYNPQTENPQREITFGEFSVTLIKHRPKK